MTDTAKGLGIWMDHQSAHLMRFTTGPLETEIIDSKFTHAKKEETLAKSENLMHHKEQHEQAKYYKELAEIIRNYDEVILFGPTDAKIELYNTLKDDHLFANIKIKVMQADKMTENEKQAFVKEYFSNRLLPG